MAEVWERMQLGSTLCSGQRSRYWLSMTRLTDSCIQPLEFTYKTGSGPALGADHPSARHFRDIHMLNQHVIVSQKTNQTTGRALLGLDSGNPYF